MSNLTQKKVSELRKLAEDAGVEGFESLDRKELLAALKPEAVEPVKESEPEEAEPEKPSYEQEHVAGTVPVVLTSKAKIMRDILRAEPKKFIFIPLAHGEKQGVTQSVTLNGYPMFIRKGMQVEVPQSVYEVLKIKLDNQIAVENHPNRVSADRPVKMTSFGSN